MRFFAAAFPLAAITSPRSAAAFSPARLACPTRLEAPTDASAASSVDRRWRRRPARGLGLTVPPTPPAAPAVLLLLRASDGDASSEGESDDAGESPPPVNPYADPNYPDLEFVNYDDPDYAVDQGLGDSEVYDNDETKTLAEIEAMREDRRRRNDEYQFETYHATVLRGGERSLGEWTVFQTDTFMGPEVVGTREPDASGVPRLLQRDRILKVVSQGSKIVTDPCAEWRVDGERIVHEERLATEDDFPSMMIEVGVRAAEALSWENEDVAHVERMYWPRELAAVDFRGPGGCMCVGKAYTVCGSRLLDGDGRDADGANPHEGPFSEMCAELGVQENGMRFRIKLDYALLEDEDGDDAPPPLHLRTLTVCRETLDGYWPDPADNERPGESEGEGVNVREGGESRARRRNQEEITAALFGPPGAPGGLYDPPPVGGEERAVGNYMLLDFHGGATVLLPHRLDQHNADGEDGTGWVTSLDWTPGRIRYQVDRKIMAGRKLKGLRTLELSEVQSNDAERWRPKDGGADMRQ